MNHPAPQPVDPGGLVAPRMVQDRNGDVLATEVHLR
jgi:hypothetical protein